MSCHSVKLNNPYGSIASDIQGNLYLADASYEIVRKLSASSPATTSVGSTSSTQYAAFGFTVNATLSANPISFTGSEFAPGGNDTCAASMAVTPATNCVVSYNFTPARPGGRSTGLTLTNASPAAVGTQGLSGIDVWAAVAFDPGAINAAGWGLTPTGIAVDPFGSIMVSDQASGSVFRFAGSVKSTIATGFKAPAGVAGVRSATCSSQTQGQTP